MLDIVKTLQIEVFLDDMDYLEPIQSSFWPRAQYGNCFGHPI